MNDISLQIGTFFPQDTAEDAEVRDRTLRWAVLSHELIYKQARGENDLHDLVDEGLLLESEKDLLEEEPSKPQVVWEWMSSYFAHLSYGSPEDGGSRLPNWHMALPQEIVVFHTMYNR